MLYRPSLLGLSLLVLTCASPTLGAVEERSTTTPDSQPAVALLPQPLLRVHRHHYHRQQHQANSVPQAAGGDPRTQLSTSIPEPLAPNSPAMLSPITPAVLPPTSPAMLPLISPVLLSPVSAVVLPPTGSATLVSTSPGTLSPTGPAVLPSTSLARLVSTSATVLPPAVPTRSSFPTANQHASVTAAQSQTTRPIGIDILDDTTNNPPAATDPGVDAGDQTDPNATTAPPLDAVDSSTPTETPPVDIPGSFSLDSFTPTLLPLAPMPSIVSTRLPSSESQFLTTSLPVVVSTPTPAASQASSSRLTLSSRSSSTPFLTSPASGSPMLGSASSVSVLLPTVSPSSAPNRDLNHPNPTSSSQQAERSKKTAVLASFLILGTLGAVVVALYCGLFRCRRRRRQDRGISSADRIAEEGLHDEDSSKLVRVNLNEKWSIVPGSPPPTDTEDFVDTLPRDTHSHTLSCSTCPPDSLNGVRGGVPGGGNRSPGQLDPGWVFSNHLQLANLALQPQGENATTHIAPSLTFTNVHLQGPETPSQSAAFPVSTPAEGQANASSSGGTPPDKSPVAGRVSTSGDSYMTCDSASKYSMASGRRASGVESVVGSSDSNKDSRSSNASGGSVSTDSERPSTPDASHSSSTTGSPSILMTPQQLVGVADVTVLSSPSPSSAGTRGGLTIARPGEEAAAGREDPDWDIVAAYSYVAREEAKETSVGELVLRSREMPPTPGKKGSSQKAVRKKNVRERRATGAGIASKSRVVGPLALGEKKVMMVHGA